MSLAAKHCRPRRSSLSTTTTTSRLSDAIFLREQRTYLQNISATAVFFFIFVEIGLGGRFLVASVGVGVWRELIVCGMGLKTVKSFELWCKSVAPEIACSSRYGDRIWLEVGVFVVSSRSFSWKYMDGKWWYQHYIPNGTKPGSKFLVVEYCFPTN